MKWQHTKNKTKLINKNIERNKVWKAKFEKIKRKVKSKQKKLKK